MGINEREEETYSLIFNALRHPLRRKILRLLADNEMAFSEIQRELSIDSGHLSYHLESLRDLVAHTPEGMYKLSSVGEAAKNLMVSVEEPRRVVARRKFRRKVGLSSRKMRPIYWGVILFLIGLVGSVFTVSITNEIMTKHFMEGGLYPTSQFPSTPPILS